MPAYDIIQLHYLFAVDSDCLDLMKTSLESEETATQAPEAASSSHPSEAIAVSHAPPFNPGAAIRMDKAKQITKSLVDQLTHLLAGDHTEDSLLTEDNLDTENMPTTADNQDTKDKQTPEDNQSLKDKQITENSLNTKDDVPTDGNPNTQGNPNTDDYTSTEDNLNTENNPNPEDNPNSEDSPNPEDNLNAEDTPNKQGNPNTDDYTTTEGNLNPDDNQNTEDNLDTKDNVTRDNNPNAQGNRNTDDYPSTEDNLNPEDNQNPEDNPNTDDYLSTEENVNTENNPNPEDNLNPENNQNTKDNVTREDNPNTTGNPNTDKYPSTEDNLNPENNPDAEDNVNPEDNLHQEDNPNTVDNPCTVDNPYTEDNPHTEDSPITQDNPGIGKNLSTQDNPKTEETLLALDTYSPRIIWLLRGTQWVKLSDLPDECPEFNVCVCGVSDGIVMFGGETDGVYTSLCYHFSVITKQWKRLTDTPNSLARASAVEFDDMRVLVAGGTNAEGKRLDTCMVLDVNHNTWSQAASLPSPDYYILLATMAGHIFILPQTSLNPQISVYDPSANTHTLLSCLPSNAGNTWGAWLMGVNNKVYLFGGKQRLALEYNPFSDQWIQLVQPNLWYSAYGCGAAVKSGNILICGGSTEEGKECDMIEEYNPATNKWTTLSICVPSEYFKGSSQVTRIKL